MFANSLKFMGGDPNPSGSSEEFQEETAPLPYGNFAVPFSKVSQTVKRFKPGTNDVVRRKPTESSQTSSRFVDSFADLESHLGINANKSQVGEISETLQRSTLRFGGMEGLPHPNQITKRKRQNIKRPSANSGNDINVHLLQLQRKQQLLGETKPMESMLIKRDQLSKQNVLEPPTPGVFLETTKQCFLTFGADASLSWTTSRVSSLSSAGEGNTLPSGAMPWEGLVASVRRQVMHAGGQQDEVVAVRTDRKRKLHSSALEAPLDHFLSLYQNSLQQQPPVLQSTGMRSGFPGQMSPFESAGSSTMVFKDQNLGLRERAFDWNHEFPFQPYETNDISLLREE